MANRCKRGQAANLIFMGTQYLQYGNLYDILSSTPSLNVTININAGQFIECIDYAVSKKNEQFKSKEEDILLTTEDVCKQAKISRPTLHRWKKAGIIPHVKIGKNVRYKQSDLIKLMNGN